MIIKSASFLTSCTGIKSCPENILPEYAFIGRSNVGKSSLLNMLAGRKGLAKTSSTPGKTQLINYFLINEQWYLVDLPGYGYAKTSRTARKKWGEMIHQYLVKRKNLVCTFILIDSRISPQEIDIDFINWVGACQLPFVIVFTKCDKTGKKELDKNIKKFQAKISEYWKELPMMYLSSTKDKRGREDILSFIEKNNTIFSEYYNKKSG